MKKTGFIILLACMILSACASSRKSTTLQAPAADAVHHEKSSGPIHTEEEKKSLDVFTQILAVTQSTDNRQSVLPRIEALYLKIIRDYPGAPLAQESYWKLISIYVNDYDPPEYDRADAHYRDFLQKYPRSPLRGYVEDVIGQSMLRHADWKRLAAFCLPTYEDYLKSGDSPRASLLFFYGEANYALGRISEAEAAYAIVADLYPGLVVGKKSVSMLQKIADHDQKNPVHEKK